MLLLADRRFSSSEACTAAGIDQATLKNWVSRDPPALLLSANERVAAGQRGSFSFSFARVMQLALVAHMVALGFAPRRAGMIAQCFTDYGDASSGWVGEGHPKTARLPNELYESGWTILLTHQGDDTGEVVNVEPGQAWDPFFSQGRGFQRVALSLNINFIMSDVLDRLGFDSNGERRSAEPT